MGLFGTRWHFDAASFTAGAALGALLTALVVSRRAALFRTISALRAQWSAWREILATGTAQSYSRDLIRWAQTCHLAGPLFLLDEIVVPPTFLRAPTRSDPLQEAEGDRPQGLPFTPDWPQLGALYGWPQEPLEVVVRGRQHVVLCGRPGSGRTVALAAIVLGARAGKLAAFIERKDLPAALLLAHAADLEPAPGKTPTVDVLVQAMRPHCSRRTLPGLPAFVQRGLHGEAPWLLLDGFDELSDAHALRVREWLGELLRVSPRLRIIVADGFRGLPLWEMMGFTCAAIAPWADLKHEAFVGRWVERWKKHIAGASASADWPSADILRGWLSVPAALTSPLEITLRLWSACAGDALGKTSASDLDALVRRQCEPAWVPGLMQLAGTMVAAGVAVLSRADGERALSSATGIETRPAVDIGAVSAELVARGIWRATVAGRLAFAHPAIAGRLAAHHLAHSARVGSAEALLALPSTAFTEVALSLAGDVLDLGPLIRDRLTTSSESLPTSSGADTTLRLVPWVREASALLECAAWLRNAGEAEWRSDVLRRLAGVVRNERWPGPLRARCACALVASLDPGILVLFRQMLEAADDAEGQVLGALGLGALRDGGAIAGLDDLLGSANREVCWAAGMGLGRMGRKEAAEALGRMLLSGEEDARRAASFGLSFDREEGYPILREAATDSDALVRRTSIGGLAQINEPWVVDVLRKVSRDDKEWVVRTAAATALEAAPEGPPPAKPADAADLPWLVAFAASRGTGVPSGAGAMGVLERALAEGNPRERLAAAEAWRHAAFPERMQVLKRSLADPDARVRSASFEGLWALARLPMIR
ncbi:MAG TPA: HEAT repeat domain-containing protein [Anaerolineales bacterium]|nr:HEAT repeat domain-containing protein [Anaerolineales bacterium]